MIKSIDRLAEYLKYKGISLNAFDRNIGASNGYTGKQIKNNASIGSDVIENISRKYTDLNLLWLLTGEGEMLRGDGAKDQQKEDCVKSKENSIIRKEDCILCKEKDRLISELEKHKETQEKFIDRLHKDLFHCEEELEVYKSKQKKAG
jgi:hypothetical protein